MYGGRSIWKSFVPPLSFAVNCSKKQIKKKIKTLTVNSPVEMLASLSICSIPLESCQGKCQRDLLSDGCIFFLLMKEPDSKDRSQLNARENILCSCQVLEKAAPFKKLTGEKTTHCFQPNAGENVLYRTLEMERNEQTLANCWEKHTVEIWQVR